MCHAPRREHRDCEFEQLASHAVCLRAVLILARNSLRLLDGQLDAKIVVDPTTQSTIYPCLTSVALSLWKVTVHFLPSAS